MNYGPSHSGWLTVRLGEDHAFQVFYAIGKQMIRTSARCALFLLALLPSLAAAQPVTLKFAYIASDRSQLYANMIKSFVDGVNADAANLVRIDVSFSGILGRDPAKQLQLVLDGTADLAFILPGHTPERFPDNAVIELPGLYNSLREATLVYSSLVAANALRGYDKLYVVGAFAGDPETIHTRLRTTSLEALKGMKIAANNSAQAAALTGLGMVPVLSAINRISGEMGSGKLDGALAPLGVMIEYGISRVASNHYLLPIAPESLLVAMNREKFDSLSAPAQNILRKFSDGSLTERYINTFTAADVAALDSLKSDPNRTITVPSQAELQQARDVFKSERKELGRNRTASC
jgi:TRAP-type C4-dicarboxylate transport system substrate-binding protein